MPDAKKVPQQRSVPAKLAGYLATAITAFTAGAVSTTPSEPEVVVNYASELPSPGGPTEVRWSYLGATGGGARATYTNLVGVEVVVPGFEVPVEPLLRWALEKPLATLRQRDIGGQIYTAEVEVMFLSRDISSDVLDIGPAATVFNARQILSPVHIKIADLPAALRERVGAVDRAAVNAVKADFERTVRGAARPRDGGGS